MAKVDPHFEWLAHAIHVAKRQHHWFAEWETAREEYTPIDLGLGRGKLEPTKSSEWGREVKPQPQPESTGPKPTNHRKTANKQPPKIATK